MLLGQKRISSADLSSKWHSGMFLPLQNLIFMIWIVIMMLNRSKMPFHSGRKSKKNRQVGFPIYFSRKIDFHDEKSILNNLKSSEKLKMNWLGQQACLQSFMESAGFMCALSDPSIVIN